MTPSQVIAGPLALPVIQSGLEIVPAIVGKIGDILNHRKQLERDIEEIRAKRDACIVENRASTVHRLCDHRENMTRLFLGRDRDRALEHLAFLQKEHRHEVVMKILDATLEWAFGETQSRE